MEENERIVNDILSSGPSSIEDPHTVVSGGEVASNTSPSATLEEKHEETEVHGTVSSVESINREEVPSRTPEIHNEDPQPVVDTPETHTDAVNEESTTHSVTEEPSSPHTEESTVIPPVESTHVEQPTSLNEESHERTSEENHPVTNTETEAAHVNHESSDRHEEATVRTEDLGVTSADVHNVTEEHHTESSPVEVNPVNTISEENNPSTVQPTSTDVHENVVQPEPSVSGTNDAIPVQPLNEVHSEDSVVNEHTTDTSVTHTEEQPPLVSQPVLEEHHEEVPVSSPQPVEHAHTGESVTSTMEPPKASADEEAPNEKLTEEPSPSITTPVNNTETVNENHADTETVIHTEEQPPVVSQPTPEEHHEETTSTATPAETTNNNKPVPAPMEPPRVSADEEEHKEKLSEEPSSSVTNTVSNTETGNVSTDQGSALVNHETANENRVDTPVHTEEQPPVVSQPIVEDHHEETSVSPTHPEESVPHVETSTPTVDSSLPKTEVTPSEPHITETGVPETPRLTSENVEGPIRPEIPSPEDKQKEDEKDKLKNIEENNAPSNTNDSAIVSPSTSEENESKEKKSKTAFDLFNEVDDDKLMYIIDRRLYDNGYQLSAFVTYIRYNSNHILDPDKKLYVLKMDNCITSNRYRSLSNKEGWKEALSYTGLDLEKMLNSGDYVFVTEEDYDKKIKKITERNANLNKVDKKDINYSTYENINRRRL